MEHRYVGVLLNQRSFRGIRTGNTGHEALYQYVLAGRRFNITPCFFRLQDIRPGQTKIKAYIYSGSDYIRTMIPAPHIIHNRAMFRKQSSIGKLDRLVQGGITIFNQYTRYGKQRIHRLLMLDPKIRISLPETMTATIQNVNGMMSRHRTLIIKPNRGSIGRGIMKLEQTEAADWKLYYRNRGRWKFCVFRDQLPLLLRRAILYRSYLVQQRLPLAEFAGRPFDFRISVQKDHSGEWKVTGIVGKAAAKRSFITNVAQGGKVYPLETILLNNLQQTPAYVRERLEQFSLRVADHLGRHLPHLADIGLDVGITPDGFPLFIECNCKDLRYSFLKGGMVEEWAATYRNPIGYARYLSGRR